MKIKNTKSVDIRFREEEREQMIATFERIKQCRKLVDRRLMQLKGMQGIGTGFKEVKGKTTPELAILCYVERKLSLDKLSASDVIPKEFKIKNTKIHTDVIESGKFRALSYKQRERPAKGGVSIGHIDITAGTLGGLVRDKATGDIYILSNNHVLANSNCGSKGDHILQPGKVDGGKDPDDWIATLERYIPIDFMGKTNYIDAAIAKPLDDNDVLNEIHDIGVPDYSDHHTLTAQDVIDGTHLQKVGRTTELTEGYVSAIDWSGWISYDFLVSAYYENQILIKDIHGVFAAGGDSGSLVFTVDKKLCALLFAGGDMETIVSPIKYAFEDDGLSIKLFEGEIEWGETISFKVSPRKRKFKVGIRADKEEVLLRERSFRVVPRRRKFEVVPGERENICE